MDGEDGEPVRPKFEIVTPEGRGHSSRGYTGPGIATYLVGEDGTTESFGGEYVGGIRQGAGKTDKPVPAHKAGCAVRCIQIPSTCVVLLRVCTQELVPPQARSS